MQTATATDEYPESFEIEIDRKALRRYYRISSFLQYLLVFLPIAAIFGFISLSSCLDTIPYNHEISFGLNITLLILFGIAQFIVVTIVIDIPPATIFYFLFSHRHEAKKARTLQVFVEGPFLRIREYGILWSINDRKLHFRAIVDYTAAEGPVLRFCKIQTLCMTTIAQGRNLPIRIPGIKDCYKVRDMLADIDRLRENDS